ncbi:MAG: indolepyruvate oxidoreductase subunit beta [Victivallales bacterium]|nr:indolepyruvate oxidoreductase subunit beta [Victivallales bacterium]
MLKNVMLCGVGGQGILFAAKIIAAAAELSGYDVTTNELHGMAQRGGSVTAQVRFGDGFHSPLFREGEADVLCALEPVEGLRCAHWLKADGKAAVSKQRLIPVTVSTGRATYPVDLDERLARSFKTLKYIDCCAIALKLGDLRLANTVMVGALSGWLDLPESSWQAAVERSVKAGLVENNMAALKAGQEA